MGEFQFTPPPAPCHTSLKSPPDLRTCEAAVTAPQTAVHGVSATPANRPIINRPSYLGPEGGGVRAETMHARVAASMVEAELMPCASFGLVWATEPGWWAEEVHRSLHALKSNYAHVTSSVRDDAVAVTLTGGSKEAVFLLADTCSNRGEHGLFSFGSHPARRESTGDQRPHVHGVFIGDIEALFTEWSKLTGESVYAQDARPFTGPRWVKGWLQYCSHANVSEYVIGAGMFAPIVANAFGLCAACGRKLDQPCRRDKTYCSAKCRQRDCRGRKRA